MQKKVLALFLALGLAIGVSAQDRELAASDAVQYSHNELMSVIKNGLENHSKAKPKFGEAGSKTNQFLINKRTMTLKRKVLFIFKAEAKTLQQIYDQLVKQKNGFRTVYSYSENVDPMLRAVGDAKGKNTARYSQYMTTAEIGVQTQNDKQSSYAKSDVTFNWQVEFGTSSKNAGKVQEVKLMSVSVTSKNLLEAEKELIATNIAKEIEYWYKNVNNNADFGKMKLNKSKCNPIAPVNASGIVIPNSAISQQLTQTIYVGESEKAPAFEVVSNDPWSFIPAADRDKYTDPRVSWTVQPNFEVSIDALTKEVEITNVNYGVKAHMPSADTKIAMRLNGAKNTAQDFCQRMKEYAQDTKGATKEQRKAITDMFANPKSKCILFSLVKNGAEDIHPATTPASYLSHMPDADMEFNFGRPQLVDNSINDVMVPFQQYYKDKKYCDNTRKQMFLKFDDASQQWLIDRIEVVEGSTEICNE